MGRSSSNSIHAMETLQPALGFLELNNSQVGPDKAKVQLKTVERGCQILESGPVVLLADEVGMGKTFEALGILFTKAFGYVRKKRAMPKVLIMVPSISLRKKWITDIRWFAEHCIIGNDPSIARIRDAFSSPYIFGTAMSYRNHSLGNRQPIAIATVNMIIRSTQDEELIRFRRWNLIVVDEAHKFRNPFSRRSGLFRKPEANGAVRPLFWNRFDKLLLMSATPFQLDVEEICNILLLGEGTRAQTSDWREAYRKQIDDLSSKLLNYKSEEARFEDAWSDLPNDQVEIAEASIKGEGAAAQASSQVAEITAFYQDVEKAVGDLRDALRSQVIRNRKSDEESGHRRTIIGSLLKEGSAEGVELTPDEEMFYLHVNKFVHDTAGRLFSVQVLQETTSSYRTLKKYQENNGWNRAARMEPELKLASKRIREAIDEILQPNMRGSNFPKQRELGDNHPKQKELLRLLGLSEDGQESAQTEFNDKLLIFCRFVQTANVLRDSINDRFTKRQTRIIPLEILSAFMSKQGSKRKFTERYEGLLRRKRNEILANFTETYAELKYLPKLMKEDGSFVRQGRGRRRFRNFRRPIRDEFHDVLLAKLKEDHILFKIMLDMKMAGSEGSMGDQQKSALMLNSVLKTFVTMLSEIEPELHRIDNEFERAPKKDQAIEKLIRLINGLRREKFAAALTGETKEVAQSRIMDSFNTPFNPHVLIVTQVGEEGVDLQKTCSRVLHYDLWWNPAVMEQRVGRVDRIGSKIDADLAKYKANEKRDGGNEGEPRLLVYEPFIKRSVDEVIYDRLQSRKKWFKLIIGKRYSEDKNLALDKLLAESSKTSLSDWIGNRLSIDLSV